MLTIEQLKALNPNDCVWLVYKSKPKDNCYATNIRLTPKMFTALSLKKQWRSLRFEMYGKTWLAYRNKEEAEGQSITLPYLLCTSSKFACVIWRDTDGKVHKTYTMPIDEAKGVLKEKEKLQNGKINETQQ